MFPSRGNGKAAGLPMPAGQRIEQGADHRGDVSGRRLPGGLLCHLLGPEPHY